eukprot:Rmarinus@m.9252
MNSSENSLQSAFLRFKERKKKLLQQAQAEEETRHRHSLLQDYDSLSPLDLRRRFFDCDEEERARRNTLRIKFVEHAKKYIGVPYARRYHAPDRDRSNDRCVFGRPTPRAPRPWSLAPVASYSEHRKKKEVIRYTKNVRQHLVQ